MDRRRPGSSRGGGLRAAALAALWVVAACSLDDLSSPVRSSDEVADDGSWVVLDLQNIRQRQAQSGATFYRALTGNPSFEVGVFRRRPGDVEAALEHPDDAMYRVIAGSGVLRTGTDSVVFEPGHLFFVRGGVRHEIDRSTSVVDLLVVFRLGEPSPADPELLSYSAEEAVAERDGEENAYTELADASTMRVGMYMIPKNGGDPFVLEHDYDEIKIVVEGGGRFDLGSGGLEAEPGTIAYITSGTRHQFRRTSDALDVIVIEAN